MPERRQYEGRSVEFLDAGALADEEIRTARLIPPAEKLLLGPQLWDQAVMLAREGVRLNLRRRGWTPSEDEVERGLAARLALFREFDSSESMP